MADLIPADMVSYDLDRRLAPTAQHHRRRLQCANLFAAARSLRCAPWSPAAEVIVELVLREISFHEGATPEMIAALSEVG